MRPSLTPAQLLKLGRSLPAAAPITPLDVSPLEVPGADLIVPEGFDGGVNIALREAVPGGVPVKVHYTTPRLLDTVEVFWGDELFPAGSLVLETETTSPVGLTVPAHLIEDGIVEAWAKVTEWGGSGEVSTGRRRYLVKLTRPGGNDTEAGEPGNQNMIAPILPPNVIQNGVGPEEVASGVLVTITAWENMAYHDVCELHWGTQTVRQTVETLDDVGKDMVITVTGDVILAGGDDSTLNVVYKLVDQVNNSSRDSEERPWSPTTYVEVYANDATLYAPFVLAADNRDDALTVVDLDALDGVGLLIEIYIERLSPYNDGQCTMTWHGVTTDGSVVDFTPAAKTAAAGRTLYFDVPNAVAEQIRGGRTVVYYTLSKPELADAHSMRASLDVIGAPLTWPAPEALDLNADDELPITLADARFRTPVYGGKAAGDRLVLCWSGVSQSGEAVNYESLPHTVTESEKNTPYTLSVPQVQLVPLDGTRATVFYKVNPGTAKERISGYLTVNVGVGSTALKEPRVTQALNGWLNPVGLPLQGAELVVPRGTVIEANDRITYFWVGNATSQKSDSTLAGPSEDIKFDITADNITPNATVEAWYTVTRGSDLKGTSPRLLLNIGVNLEIKLYDPVVLEAVNGELDPVNAVNGATVCLQYEPMLAEDWVAAFWEGAAGEGTPSLPWADAQIGVNPLITVPASAITANLGRTVNVRYWVLRAPDHQYDPALVSNEVVLTIKDAPLVLPAPTINGQPDSSVLDPMIVGPEGIVVHCEYDRQPEDGVTLSWDGDTAFTPTPGNASDKFVNFTVTPAHIAPYLGKSLTVFYTVRRDGKTEESLPLDLRVLNFRDEDLSDSIPRITQATDDQTIVDLSTFTGDAEVTVAPWPLMTAGQHYWLQAQGTLENGAGFYPYLAFNQPVSAVAQVSSLLLRSRLESLKDESDLVVTMKVTFDGGPFENDAVVFPSRRFTVRTIADTAPQITDVWGASGAVGENGSTVDTSLTLSGTATRDQLVEIFDGATSLGTVSANGQGNWTFVATPLIAGAHVFVAIARYGSGKGSNDWRLSVVVAGPPPLQIDTTTMQLNGYTILHLYWDPLYDVDRNFAVRRPEGGVPPYRYSSSDPRIATVDLSGKVVGIHNGSATIYVSDMNNAQVHYTVTVSNVWHMERWYRNGGRAVNNAEALMILHEEGLETFEYNDLRILQSKYGNHLVQFSMWTGVNQGSNGLYLPGGYPTSLLLQPASTLMVNVMGVRSTSTIPLSGISASRSAGENTQLPM